ncbi:MAG: hypothetical protein Q4G69_08055 [Planctomycetia bacterium]|nr:hypothetical protein [Planctomycetia bacterium]
MSKLSFGLFFIVLILIPWSVSEAASARSESAPISQQSEESPKEPDRLSDQDPSISNPSISDQEDSDRKTIEYMDEKIEEMSRFPWFSGKDREVKFIPPEKVKYKAPRVYKKSNKSGILQMIWIAAIIILLIALGILIWFVYKKLQKKKLFFDPFHKKEEEENRRRLENLPLEAKQNLGNLDQSALQAYLAGDYRKAIIYYFSFMLIELDRNHRIRMKKGRTNRDYLNEIRVYRQLALFYKRTMILFEKTYYGTWKISKEDFEEVWNEKSLFSAELRKIQEVQNRQKTVPPFAGILLLLFSLLFLSGCEKKWDDKYTAYIPRNYSDSMNGIELFQELCKEKGYHVKYYWRFPLPQKTGDFDTILWFYDSWNHLELPSTEFAKEVEKWLSAHEGRTLIFIDNSYRADVPYWEKIQKIVPGEHRWWVETQLAAAKANEKNHIVDLIHELKKQQEESSKKAELKKDENDPEYSVFDEKKTEPLWFKFSALKEVKTGFKMEGESYWTNGIHPVEPYRFCRILVPLKGTKTVLAVEGKPLILERKIGSGKLYIVQSGSFLMNYPLLQKDRQLLANRLIDRFGSKEKGVYIQYGPFLRLNEDELHKVHLPFYLRATPFAVLFWHLVFLSVLITFWKFLIFGRPKELPSGKNADFGKHLSAYGDLIEKTGDRSWVKKQIDLFKQNYQKEDPS